MSSHYLNISRWAARSVLFLSFFRHVPALTVEYCSSLNTASGDPSKLPIEHDVVLGLMLILPAIAYWKYQSNGWCHDHCVGNYAFAIVQDFNCWCSDYAPGVTSSSDNCNTKCPGYSELCGGNDYYGYIALNKAPSGTIGASDSAASIIPVSHPFRSRSMKIYIALTISFIYLLSPSDAAMDLLYLSAILTSLQNQVTVTASGAPVTIFSTVTPTPSQTSPASSTFFV